MTRHENSTRQLAAGALVSDVLGFCLILVGAFGPAWSVIRSSDGHWWVNEGIWLASYCTHLECKTSTRERVLEEVNVEYKSALEEYHWTEFKVLSILAIVGSFVAVTTTAVVLVKTPKTFHTSILIISGVSALSSCMFLLVPVLKTSATDSKATFADAWTKVVAAVGVLLHFIATVIQVFAVYQSCQNYCARKQSERSRQRRLGNVVRYLTSQGGEHSVTASVSQIFQPVVGPTGDLILPTTGSGIDSRNSSICGPPPYAVATDLPAYSEITEP